MTDRETARSRRRFLGLVGTGVAGALAGCNDGGGGEGDGPPTSGRALERATTVIGHAFPYVVEEYELNPWVADYQSGFPSLLFEYPSTTTPDGTRRLTDLVTDVSVAEDAVTVSYSEAYSWWSGDPVTARDQWVAMGIDDALGVRTGVERAELVDEYALRYEFPEPVRRSVALTRALEHVHNTPAWLYERWLDELTAASTRTETESVAAELHDWTLGLDDAAERGIGCGPYELTEVSPNRLMLRRFEDHPNADDVAVPRAWFPVARETRAEELTNRGVLDVGQGVLKPPGQPRDLPDHVDQLSEHTTQFGTALLCNYHARHVGRRNVRRAMVCVLPLETLNRNGRWGVPASLQTGLAEPQAERWLDDSLREALYGYPVERDDGRAAEFMRRAGYDRQGGDWVGPDGNPAELHLKMPLWGRWSQVAEIIETTLDDFGFDVDLDRFAEASLRGSVAGDSFQVTAYRTTGTPFEAYDVTATALGGLGSGVTDSDRETGERGRPMELSIPAEPGRLTVDGDGRRVDLYDLFRELQSPTSDERAREVVALFARWWNYDLPNVQLATASTGVWGNTRDYEWPDRDGDAYLTSGPSRRVDYHLLRTGAVSPAGRGTATDDGE